MWGKGLIFFGKKSILFIGGAKIMVISVNNKNTFSASAGCWGVGGNDESSC